MSAPESETQVSNALDNILILIEASKLSLDDEFMKHKPITDAEKQFKGLLRRAIKSGVKDFYRPCLDPSFNKNGRLCYEAGNEPAVGKCFDWWVKSAKNFMSERGSRLGTELEYTAFLGVLIKELVAKGWSVKKAWDSVCNDSKKLGHYWNSKDAKFELEHTGSRKVGRFYDLANTCKILAEDEELNGFWLAGGTYFFSHDCPLANLKHYRYCSNEISCSVGWIVIPA